MLVASSRKAKILIGKRVTKGYSFLRASRRHEQQAVWIGRGTVEKEQRGKGPPLVLIYIHPDYLAACVCYVLMLMLSAGLFFSPLVVMMWYLQCKFP